MDTKKLRQKILDLAIRGKLVPQDPNDEPAIDLLKRINPKFEPCENNPYDIPESWSWTRGVDIYEPMKSTSPSGATFKYIDIDSIDNKRNIIISAKRINTKDAPSRASRYTEKCNVLFSMVRPYLRNIAMVTEDDCIASTGFYVCRAKVLLDRKFCYFMMLSGYVVDGLNSFMKGDNSPSINKSHIESFAFPLPPLNEQKRIVAATVCQRHFQQQFRPVVLHFGQVGLIPAEHDGINIRAIVVTCLLLFADNDAVIASCFC